VAGRLSAVFVTDGAREAEETLRVAQRAVQGGATAVVVRMPHAPARDLYEVAKALRPAVHGAGALLMVHDRIDVALALRADGVHLAARSMPLAAARSILRKGMWLGFSVHNLDEAGQAEAAGADYLFLGPVFPTASHPERAPLGLDTYREAVLRARVPVLAIGGVDLFTVPEVAGAGGKGAAAISAFYDAPDPAETARLFRAAFGA